MEDKNDRLIIAIWAVALLILVGLFVWLIFTPSNSYTDYVELKHKLDELERKQNELRIKVYYYEAKTKTIQSRIDSISNSMVYPEWGKSAVNRVRR